MSESQFLKDFKSVRRVSVPIVAVETSDPAATMRAIAAVVDKVPLVKWDIVDGVKAGNKEGDKAVKLIAKDRDPKMMNNPAEFLTNCTDAPKDTVIFFLNGHRFVGNENTSQAAVGQAIWNLRDKFKQDERTLVILCPIAKVPLELKQDIIVLEEPLPGTEQLREVVNSIYEAVNKSESIKVKLTIDEPLLDKSTEAIRGLSTFAAEQVVAMSMTKEGVDLKQLWERKRKQIEQTPGLSVYRGKETFNDVRGVTTIKTFLSRLFKGNSSPTVVVFMDEIEKMFAGIGGDLSGTSQEQHGEFLRWMQDNEILGLIEVGHPGCSKSILAKACAGEFGVPMIELNVSALKGSLVGQTGQQTRDALRTIGAIGRPVVLATSNSLAILPPELKRRFQLGTWFFDLPDKSERDAVWNLYITKYKLTDKQRPDDDGWTPADIKTCCEVAWRLKSTLEDASQYIVPISKSDPEKIEKLRRDANNRFNSASHPGPYVYAQIEAVEKGLRKVRVGDVGEA